MPPADATLTITIESDPATAARTLVLRCPHARTTVPLPATADPAAERVATTLAVLQHYRTTACACARRTEQESADPSD